MRKHFFLIVALGVIGLMLVAGGIKLLAGGGQSAAGPGGAPGGFAGGPGGPGGPGGGPPGGAGGFRRAVQVSAVSPQVRAFVDRIEVLGGAKARQSITLTAAATQLISRLRFESGQYVRQGQVLAELNTLEQDAGVVQAQSQVALAKSNWDRWQQLADRGIAPAATAEQFKAQYDQAQANLKASQARVGDRTIRAPFSGTVGLTDAAPGMLVNPGAVIATLDDLSVIRVDFPVPENFIPVLREGLPIQAVADAYPAETFRGVVAKLDTRVDQATRSVVARAEFPNPGSRLRPGMLMRVRIERAVRQNPAVPEAAVVFEDGEAYVLLLQPAPAGQGGGAPGQPRANRPPGAPAGAGAPPRGAGRPGGFGGGQGGPPMIAVRHIIGTGLRQDGWVEITSGLEPGQRVVADGTNRVRPNDPVQVAGGGRPQGAGQGQAPGRGPVQGEGAAAPAALPAQRPAGPRAEQGAPPASAAPAGAPPAAGQGMFQADSNGDGAIDRAEWTATGRPDGFFSRLDANADGRVTRAEMQALRANGPPGGG